MESSAPGMKLRLGSGCLVPIQHFSLLPRVAFGRCAAAATPAQVLVFQGTQRGPCTRYLL